MFLIVPLNIYLKIIPNLSPLPSTFQITAWESCSFRGKLGFSRLNFSPTPLLPDGTRRDFTFRITNKDKIGGAISGGEERKGMEKGENQRNLDKKADVPGRNLLNAPKSAFYAKDDQLDLEIGIIN